MNLKQYQEEARKTDQAHKKGSVLSYIVPLLGIIGELGSLVSEFKKMFRDGKSHTKFTENLREELGDVLWYVANIASKFNIDLEDIARFNLEKVRERFPGYEKGATPLFDAYFAESEQLPREMEIIFSEQQEGVVIMSCNGKQLGDPLTDNSYSDDGYRYHDVFHLSYLAILGWSPVLRKLLKVKRKSVELIDEVQDGARAAVIEEAISAFVYSQAKNHDFYHNITRVDDTVIETIKSLVDHLEVSMCTSLEWEKAILQGCAAFRKIRENKGGKLIVSLNNRSITAI